AELDGAAAGASDGPGATERASRGTVPSGSGSGTVARGPADERGHTEPGSAERTARSFTRTRPSSSGGIHRGRRRLLGIVAAGAVAAVVAVTFAATRPSTWPAETTAMAAPELAGDARAASELGAVVEAARAASAGAPAVAEPGARFSADGTVAVEGRLGNAAVPPGERADTYMMLELRGKDVAPTARAKVHLALVIDRSGSMGGERLRNAVAAAVGAVGRLENGDMVSVTAFDTQTQRVVAPTVLGDDSRPRVVEAIQRLWIGGDTCISCGLEAALADLGGATGYVGRILLLSDGAANVGVVDEAGMSKLGQRAQSGQVSITTIGLGADYNERILTAIARESNGRHYYAESELALGRIFDTEAVALGGVVATNGVARIELAPGVEFGEVYDRAFSVEGSAVVVPLGPFPRGEVKTVLLRVSVVAPRAPRAAVGHITVSYRDQLGDHAGATEGALALAVVPGASRDATDPTVDARVGRSETATSLVKANALFAAGKVADADAVLAAQQARLAARRADWVRRDVRPEPALGADLDGQEKRVSAARAQYRAIAASRPSPVAAKSVEARKAARGYAMDAYESTR
ncbi:MAG: VWA domain-containing protein, partial [Myxococcales bacterium]|nr:VWA domain-containing protein [Myxococcales bacterium]